MKKESFLNTPEVSQFVEWCSEHFPNIKATLSIRSSRFVPGGVNVTVKDADELLDHYIWRASGLETGGFDETEHHLTKLSSLLKSAVDKKDEDAALSACRKILEWGGNRNYATGAYPFLERKYQKRKLCKYLKKTRDAFSLNTTNLKKISPPVKKMNSMLTKIHSLNAVDGLPIYDSRVAAAIATLVEMWRQDTNQTHKKIPKPLRFPATMASRTVNHAFDDAESPGLIVYSADQSSATWSSAKIRLAWISEAVLARAPRLFHNAPNRMRAFEASLFILGYDVSCLTIETGTSPGKRPQEKLRTKVLKAEKLIENINEIQLNKNTEPLSGRGKEIGFDGSIGRGIYAKWGQLKTYFEPELLEELITEFAARDNVPLGAEQGGSGPEDSLGIWLQNEHGITPRFASALAPILKEIGVISHTTGQRPIYLHFR